MKTIYLICLSALFFSFAGENSLNREFVKFELNGKTLYIAKYEVNNGIYYKFLDDIKHDGDLLTKARVFSENWKNELEFSENFVDYYFGKDEAYKNYPLVNITHEGAELFCVWASEKLSEQYGKKVIARLPTKEEWLYAAQAGNDEAIYGWKGNDLYNENGDSFANFKKEDEDKTITAPVNAYKPNKLGLYNCSGNVSEMIQTPNISMGGDWKTTEENITLEKSAKDYSKANPYTGFRIILEIE